MAFITKTDMYSHIYEEDINVIDRTSDTDSALSKAILGGIAEAQGYLSKYDIDFLFGQTGDDRDPILKLQVGNLIAFHFIGLCNANVNYAVIEDRYTKASTWFDRIQKNRISPYGWPPRPINPVTGADPASTIKFGSNPSRKPHY